MPLIANNGALIELVVLSLIRDNWNVLMFRNCAVRWGLSLCENSKGRGETVAGVGGGGVGIGVISNEPPLIGKNL